jgi:hypothetical protein
VPTRYPRSVTGCPTKTSPENYALACAAALDRKISSSAETLAFILEPVGGLSTGAVAAGQLFPGNPRYLHAPWRLFVFGKVLGAGPTGRFLAAHHWPDALPDVIVMAKGIGAGYAPLGAMMAPARMVDELAALTGFEFTYSYNANPISCAAGIAVLDEFDRLDLVERARVHGESLRRGLEAMVGESAILGDVRGIGLLLAVEMVADKAAKLSLPNSFQATERIRIHGLENGIMLYSRLTAGGRYGHWFMVAPPLTITESEIGELLSRTHAAVQDWARTKSAGVLSCRPRKVIPDAVISSKSTSGAMRFFLARRRGVGSCSVVKTFHCVLGTNVGISRTRRAVRRSASPASAGKSWSGMDCRLAARDDETRAVEIGEVEDRAQPRPCTSGRPRVSPPAASPVDSGVVAVGRDRVRTRARMECDRRSDRSALDASPQRHAWIAAVRRANWRVRRAGRRVRARRGLNSRRAVCRIIRSLALTGRRYGRLRRHSPRAKRPTSRRDKQFNSVSQVRNLGLRVGRGYPKVPCPSNSSAVSRDGSADVELRRAVISQQDRQFFRRGQRGRIRWIAASVSSVCRGVPPAVRRCGSGRAPPAPLRNP